jgi:MoaA/NifB/PqqE/SkfB family radical SAM enzyme
MNNMWVPGFNGFNAACALEALKLSTHDPLTATRMTQVIEVLAYYHAMRASVTEPLNKPVEPKELEDIVSATIAERGKVYGDPFLSHKNIGKSWTALLNQHYGLDLKDIPASLVAQMMVCFKMQRSAKVYKDDNYIDAHAYTKFADEFQKKEQNNG